MSLVTFFPIRTEARRGTSRGYKLSLMRSQRLVKLVGIVISLSCGFLAVACGREVKPNSEDSAQVVVAPIANKSATSINTGWDEHAAGQFMILSAADDGVTAALVMPNETDSSLAQKKTFQIDALANTPVDLFNAAG